MDAKTKTYLDEYKAEKKKELKKVRNVSLIYFYNSSFYYMAGSDLRVGKTKQILLARDCLHFSCKSKIL